MKLNQRDKFILIVVFVIIIWIIGVLYFIKPAIEDVQKASNTLDEKTVELNTAKQQVKDDENLPAEADALYSETQEIAGVFYPVMRQHEAMTEVQGLFDVNGDDEQDITNLQLTINEISSTTISRFEYSRTASTTALDSIVDSANGTVTEEVETAESTPIELSAYSMSFTYEATKEQLMTFVENLQTATHRSLVIESLSISDIGENEEDTEFTGSISMTFMMVPDITSPDAITESVSEAVAAIEAD